MYLTQSAFANVSTVKVNDVEYRAFGKGAAAIVTSEGQIDTEAAVVQGRGEDATTTPVFAEAGVYELTVTSVGFTELISFRVEIQK